MMQRPYWLIIRLLLCLLAIGAALPVGADETPQRVLLINSYHYGLSWTDRLTDGIFERLEPFGADIVVEYMDTKRQPLADTEPMWLRHYRERHANQSYDVVIVTDNDALNFARRHRLELFPDTPIVFTGINYFTPDLLDDSGWFTGVQEVTDPLGTFEWIRRLRPDVERVWVIADGTPTGIAESQAARSVLGTERAGIHIQYWDNPTLADLLEKLRALDPERDAVLLTVFNLDAAGQFFAYEDSAERITEAAPCPVFGLWDFYLGTGVAGGRMASGVDQGRAAGQLAAAILDGAHPRDLPIIEDSPNRDLFDATALLRFGIEPAAIHEPAVVVGQTPEWVARGQDGFAQDTQFAYDMFARHGVVMMLVDPDNGHILDANRAAVDFYGFPREELLRMSIAAINTMSEEEVGAEISLARAEERNYFRFRHQLASGDIRDVEVHSWPITIEGHTVLYSIIQDVTEQVAAQAEVDRLLALRTDQLGQRTRWLIVSLLLFAVAQAGAMILLFRAFRNQRRLNAEVETSERKLAMFFSQSLHGFFMCMLDEPIAWNEAGADKDKLLEYALDHQRMTKVNQAMLDQYGAKEEDFVGITVRELFKHDLDHAREIWRGLMDKGKWHTETAEQKMDGTPIVIDGEYTCLYDQQGRITGHFGVQMDVTERKRAEEETRHARNQYQSLVDNIPGITYRCLCDDDWTMLFLSDAVDPLSGYPASDFIHNAVRTYESVVHRGDTERLACGIWEAVAEGRPWDIEYRICHKDGGIRWVHEKGRGIYGEDGGVAYLDGFILDITERKKAEQALVEREREQRLLMENAISGIAIHEIVLDEQGKPVDYVFVDANEAFEKHTGLRVADVVARRVTDVLPGIEKTHFIETYGTVALTGEPISFEEYSPPLDRYYSINAYSTGGGRFVTVFSDITARKKADRVLRENEQRFNLAIEGTGAGLWDWDMVNNTVYFSPRWKMMLGYEDHEVANAFSGWKDLWHPDDTARIEQALNDHLDGKTTAYEVEHRLHHKSGEWRWILTRGDIQKDKTGKPIRWTGTNLDITEQRAMQQQVEEQAENQRILLDNIQTQVWYLTDEHTYGAVNEAHAAFFGVEKEALAFKSLYDFMPAEEVEICRVSNRKVFEERATVCTEEWVVDGRGEKRLLAIMKAPKLHEDGSVEYIVCSAEDITERKQAEADLLRTNRELEDATARANQMALAAESANMAKSEFLANMSHEIRTPMNGVLGMNYLLLETELTEKQRHYARAACSSAESLLAIINDILDFSKIEAGKLELEHVGFSLSDMLGEVEMTLRTQAEAKGIGLQCAMDEGLPALMTGDPVRLRQVLTNLTGNAIKFTKEGAVTVHVGQSSETKDGQVSLRFSVTDTGIGIPPERLDRLFQQFSQVDSSTTRQYGGTGLGLAISKQLVELMGGEIGVESEPGKGSTFWFVLPMESDLELVADTNPDSSGTTDWTDYFAGRDVRVLLVEDNDINQQVALSMLKLVGLEADAAENGREALDAMARKAYDIILMDVQMPVMDGYEATRQIRTLEQSATNCRAAACGVPQGFEKASTKHEARKTKHEKRIPIIAMTANAMQGDREECLAVGMDDYVSKPIAPGNLGQVLQRWLPGEREGGRVDELAVGASGDAPSNEYPTLDWDGYLERMMGNRRIATTVMKATVGSMPGLLSKLCRSVETGDAQGVARDAHALKGAAGNVGGEALRELARMLEEAGNATDLARIRAIAPNLEAVHAAFQDAVQAVLEEG